MLIGARYYFSAGIAIQFPLIKRRYFAWQTAITFSESTFTVEVLLFRVAVTLSI